MKKKSFIPLTTDLQLHLALLRDGEKTIDKEMGSKENLG
jgi:hypothetical protein